MAEPDINQTTKNSLRGFIRGAVIAGAIVGVAAATCLLLPGMITIVGATVQPFASAAIVDGIASAYVATHSLLQVAIPAAIGSLGNGLAIAGGAIGLGGFTGMLKGAAASKAPSVAFNDASFQRNTTIAGRREGPVPALQPRRSDTPPSTGKYSDLTQTSPRPQTPDFAAAAQGPIRQAQPIASRSADQILADDQRIHAARVAGQRGANPRGIRPADIRAQQQGNRNAVQR